LREREARRRGSGLKRKRGDRGWMPGSALRPAGVSTWRAWRTSAEDTDNCTAGFLGRGHPSRLCCWCSIRNPREPAVGWARKGTPARGEACAGLRAPTQ
jgi:hypothetical protein